MSKYTIKRITLDLHGVKHFAVANTVKRFIEDNWGSIEPVEIISGHSKQMQEHVVEELLKYKLTYHLQPHKIIVYLND